MRSGYFRKNALGVISFMRTGHARQEECFMERGISSMRTGHFRKNASDEGESALIMRTGHFRKNTSGGRGPSFMRLEHFTKNAHGGREEIVECFFPKIGSIFFIFKLPLGMKIFNFVNLYEAI